MLDVLYDDLAKAVHQATASSVGQRLSPRESCNATAVTRVNEFSAPQLPSESHSVLKLATAKLADVTTECMTVPPTNKQRGDAHSHVLMTSLIETYGWRAAYAQIQIGYFSGSRDSSVFPLTSRKLDSVAVSSVQ